MSDVTLLARCRAGEPLAWKSLYEAHFDFIYRVARRLGTPEEETEDVCQEVFLVAYRRFSSFNDGRLTTWLYRITANVASARHRKRRVREMWKTMLGRAAGENGDDLGLADDARGSTPERELAAREMEEGVRRILERMAPKKREVFALHELEGLSGEEIAERVGCKLDTVWTRLHYARLDFERMARKRGLVP